MSRKFEKVSLNTFSKFFENLPIEVVERIYQEVQLPKRKTEYSAGYDFISPFEFNLEPDESIIIPTGVKAYMNPSEFLGIYIRSSFGIKKDIILKNGVGIIDADYADNESNEGHIMIAIRNIGHGTLNVKAGEAVAQGIFQSYQVTDDDNTKAKRVGGIGSTSKNVEIKKARVMDAHQLLNLQRASFAKYSVKYGKFEADPCNMTLHRMEFNIKYRLGDYQKIMLDDEIIGGIFGFMLEEENTWKVAQFYILPEYEHLGYGSKAIQDYFDLHKDVKVWYADTIKQETANLNFYKKFGFQIIDEEEEHKGLSFVTLIKK